jgi:hypothetical protein
MLIFTTFIFSTVKSSFKFFDSLFLTAKAVIEIAKFRTFLWYSTIQNIKSSTFKKQTLKCKCLYLFLGPAVSLIDGRITLIGVISFSIGIFCDGQAPEGYFRVSHQLEWIHKNTDVSEWECNNGAN